MDISREIYISDFIKQNIRTQNFPTYPACNLMYYIILTTLKRHKNIILETGTFHGISTAVIAQAAEDVCINTHIHTIEINKQYQDKAIENIKISRLRIPISFINGDSHIEIPKLLEKIDRLDFAFLDADHSFNGVYTEFNLIKDIIKASNGYVYFDNTEQGGVNEALIKIKSENDCNLIRFPYCSFTPPGQALLHF